jgi:hypothetical protein
MDIFDVMVNFLLYVIIIILIYGIKMIWKMPIILTDNWGGKLPHFFSQSPGIPERV